jgi:hypothetical protein
MGRKSSSSGLLAMKTVIGVLAFAVGLLFTAVQVDSGKVKQLTSIEEVGDRHKAGQRGR